MQKTLQSSQATAHSHRLTQRKLMKIPSTVTVMILMLSKTWTVVMATTL